MAKKRLTDVPSAKAVQQFLDQRKFDLAAAEARKLVGFAPGPTTAELLRASLFGLAEAHLERKQYADFNRAVQELEPLCVAAGSESIRTLGRLLLRGLQPKEVLRLIDASTEADLSATLRGDLADYFVRTRITVSIPPEWQEGYAGLQTALQHYDAKRDEAAREALNAIGLGSPFLEWKLWLRGLLAWGANDAARALENWARLNPTRLPHRLAAPLRAAADRAWCADQPALREQLSNQYQRLGTVGLAGELRHLRPELGGRKGLAKAIKMAEGLLPALKSAYPALVPGLRNVVYHAMLKRGEPGDLERFVKVFGRMPDDPTFAKLSAQIFDSVDDAEQSLVHWGRYVDWLRGTAPWPPLLKKQAIAIVYRTMAKVAAEIDEFDPDDELDFFSPPRKAKPKPKTPAAPPPEPSEFLLKALEYAPAWEEAAADLMDAYLDDDDTKAAAAFAESFLAANPTATAVSQAYVDVLMRERDFTAALARLDRLRKTSPFDATIRYKTAECVLHCSYASVQNSEFESAAALLAEERDLLDGEAPVMAAHLRYALSKKSKRKGEAEPDLGVPVSLLSTFLLAANAQLFKAKPAEKSAATKAYKAALAADPGAAEVLELYRGYLFFRTGAIEFTGQKAMQKGILDALVKSAADPALTEQQGVELIAHLGPMTTVPKIEKLAEGLGKRFPNNPVFALCIVELWAATHPTSRPPYKILKLLRKARELAKNSTEPAYKLLEARIGDLTEQLDPFAALNDMFGFH